MKDDIFYMNQCLNLAQKASQQGEVPVGAIIVRDGQIVSTGFNTRESKQSSLGHAEIGAIQDASKKLGSWRLETCQIYSTLEPCLMCIGAILQSRISRLVYGCHDKKKGFDSFYQFTKNPSWNHELKISYGVLSQECSQLLKDFFKELRIK